MPNPGEWRSLPSPVQRAPVSNFCAIAWSAPKNLSENFGYSQAF